MGQLGIHHDSIVTKRLLSSSVEGSTFKLATGYFNLTQEYMETITNNCLANCSILMAHPNVRILLVFTYFYFIFKPIFSLQFKIGNILVIIQTISVSVFSLNSNIYIKAKINNIFFYILSGKWISRSKRTCRWNSCCLYFNCETLLSKIGKCQPSAKSQLLRIRETRLELSCKGFMVGFNCFSPFL